MYLSVNTESQQSVFINIHDIKEIHCDEGQLIAVSNDGTTHATEWSDVVRATATVIPADKNETAFRLFVLECSNNDEFIDESGIGFSNYRVLAWAISPFMQPVPITAAGYLVPKMNELVLTKVESGQFYGSNGKAFGDFVDAQRDLAAQVNSQRAWRLGAAAPSAPTNPEAE